MLNCRYFDIIRLFKFKLLNPKFGGKSGEGASIVSGGSIIGEKENLTDADNDNRFEPKMLLFNGLYYHGNWATPFQVISIDFHWNLINECHTPPIF